VYFLLGACLTLAFLLIVNLIVAVLASALWKVASPLVRDMSVNMRSQIILGLRILPVAASVIFIAAFLIPSYLLNEPVSAVETVSSKLALIALISSLGVCIALYKVFETWLATRRLAADWLCDARQIRIADISVPVYRIKHQFPVIAVIGIFRPRMFVAEQVLDSLNHSEFRAAIAHEYGHLRANDNFKRTVLRICRDLLIVPLGKGLDRAWADNAESLADEYAAQTGPSAALNLASALVKIAKIVPTDSGPAMPAGAYLVEDLSVDVTSRVRRLLRYSDDPSFAVAGMSIFGRTAAFWMWSAALLLLLVVPLIDERSLAGTHEIVEQFVNILQ